MAEKGLLGIGNGSDSLEHARLEQLQQQASRAEKLGSGTPRDLKEAEKAAKDFEALLVNQMLKSMWSSVPKDGLMTGGREEEFFRDMLNEALSDSLATNQSMGIKDIVLKEFKARRSKE